MIYTEIWGFKKGMLLLVVLALNSCSSETDNNVSNKSLSEGVVTVDTTSKDIQKIEVDIFHENLEYVLDSIINWQNLEEEDSSVWYSEIMYLYFVNHQDKCQLIIGSTQDYDRDVCGGFTKYKDYLIVYYDHFQPCVESLIKKELLDSTKPDDKYFYAADLIYEGFEFRYNIDNYNNLKLDSPKE